MEDTNRVYRIRTVVGEDAPNVIHVPLNQSYDMFEILSLKLDQTNTYKTYESDYGVIVGRVTANGGFGVPNAKVSVFIEVSDDETLKNRFLYNYTSTSDTDYDGVRYNVLPDFVDDVCHQDVGTFPNKRLVLDNKDVIEIFDKYWKYTTTTNHAGDYMLFGIPTGSQQLHVDVDLSDCGILSQRPRDMIGKGYNANMFESPNKFKYSTNLNSLAQIISQDRGVYVYPYWGDVSDGDDKFSITRCDINLEYKFESYAVFIGSIVTDKGSNAIGKNCTGTEQNGKMSDLIAGEGTIEMIRKTLDGKVEEFPIMGNRLIDGDGVWCYQIPMNLDYVTTDEFGNLVPTDNPDKGIATRTRVRFRISLDENPNDATARKRAKYLVPNNPRMGEGDFDDSLDADYEFGSATREESYCDMFWNKVYSVKNYIPKLQKNSKETNRKHTGIKLVNHYGDNNPMPYNALTIKLTFTYRIICVITKVVINLIEFINEIISLLGAILCLLIKIIELPGEAIYKIFKKTYILKSVGKAFRKLWRSITSPITKLIKKIMPRCIGLSSEFCDDGINQVTYYVGCGYFFFQLFKYSDIGLDCVWEETAKNHRESELKICENEKKTMEECKLTLTEPSNSTAMLYNCVENQLAQQNDATSFNFNNDWINGVLYAPLWYRKITPKKRFFFGLFRKKAKDDWCSSKREYPGMRILQQCTIRRDGTDIKYKNFDDEEITLRYVNDNYKQCDSKCHKSYVEIKGMNGVIESKQTMLDQTVYYYRAVEYDASLPSNEYYIDTTKKGDVKLLFATDIILLGSLNDCDINGIPQFFKTLESTTYNMPTDILFTDYDFILTLNDKTGESERMEYEITDLVKTSEMAGCDWGNPNEFDKYDGGLFYSIGCSSGSIKLDTKSCVNLARICEYGVSLDETKEVADLEALENASDEQIDVDTTYFQRLITDGFVSWDELYNLDERSMFATMNGNKLQTKLNTRNGLKEYDFRYLYPENFDGMLRQVMENRTKRYAQEINYKQNYKLETASRDYYLFRMGNKPYFYDKEFAFPRYENSFYFYFGLKAGKTAIEKFNSKYFAECVKDSVNSQIGIKSQANSWCSRLDGNENDGYVAFDFNNIATPYDLLINGVSDGDFSVEVNQITEDKIIIINNGEAKPQKLSDYTHLKGEANNVERTVYTYSQENGASVIRMLENGAYQGILTDNEGEITEFYFNILGTYLLFKLNTEDFEQPNNVLIERFGSLQAIAANATGITVEDDGKRVNREIGGVVTVYDIFMDGEELDYYRIELRAKKGTPLDLSGQYSGATIIKTNSIQNNGAIYVNNTYAFGLPKGNCEYTITITQLCKQGNNFVDSKNIVSKDFFVSEPKPYKMFINDIDYDVIKRFDNNTGWNLSGSVSNHNATLINGDKTIPMTNPWFKVDNIYYNEHIVPNINNNDIIEFEVEDINDSYHVYAVTEDNRYEVSLTTLRAEFCTNNENHQNVMYNWVDDYIVNDEDIIWSGADTNVDDKTIDFVNRVNTVFNLRKELVSMMKDTFFLMCESDTKTLLVRGQTNKRPCMPTIVYHPEKAVEYENYNVLDGTNLKDEDIDEIRDIKIPTITYKSNSDYATGDENDDRPCVATVENIDKKPYSTGIMNYAGVSIPKKTNGDSFPFVERDSAKYIKHSDTNFNDLFSFPLIDKILKTDYIAWSAFVNIPKYGYENDVPRIEIVTMNGLLACLIYNGNITNNKFEVQELNGLELALSDNLTDTSTTYIEKRVVIGFDYHQVGEWLLSFLRNEVNEDITQELIDTVNSILPISVDGDNIYNIINSLTIDGNSICYNDTPIVDIQNIIQDVLSFTNYITIQNSQVQSIQQYAFLLPIETEFTLEDTKGCGYNEVINGGAKITLSEESVNNCKTGDKILKVETEEDVVFSIFKCDANGDAYPLNKATRDGIVYKINDTVYGIYDSTSNQQNLFSYQMKTEYLRGTDNLIDKNFKSQTLVSEDGEQEEYTTTRGYGTTGEFNYVSLNPFTPGMFNYPIFIVAETENHLRILSPIYDYSTVYALVKYGILKRKDVEITTDETTGEKVYTVLEPTEDYKFGIAVKKGHFYLDNYIYKLSGVCKVDGVNTIEVTEDTLMAPEQYLFTTITENLYKTLKAKLKNLITRVQFAANTTITAIDYTGLKHICGIDYEDLEDAETEWYTYIWDANMPIDEETGEPYTPSSANGGMLYKNTWIGYIEFNYEKDELIEPMECIEGVELGYGFLGWTENQPNRNGPFITFTGEETATEPKIYFGNWDTPLPLIIVHFFDSDATTLITDLSVEQGDNVDIADNILLSPFSWYLLGDENQTIVSFPYGPINEETSFVKWQAPTLTVYFLNTSEEVLDVQTVEERESVNLREDLTDYTWYNRNDMETPITEWPYGPIMEDTYLIGVRDFTTNWIVDTENTETILPPPTCLVHFRNAEDNLDLDTQTIVIGENVSPRGNCVEHDWYLRGDNTQVITFPQMVFGETWYVQVPEFEVNWYDEEEGFVPPTPSEDVYVFESQTPVSQTISAETTLTEIKIKSTCNGNLIDFSSQITTSSSWLSIDSTKSADGMNKTLTIKVRTSVNNDNDARTAEILLTQNGSNNQITITIIQNKGYVTLRWRVENHMSSNTIESGILHFADNIINDIGFGGGLQPMVGVREGSVQIPNSLKTTGIICESVELGGFGPDVTYHFQQTPNPYIWNGNAQGGNVKLLIKITD